MTDPASIDYYNTLPSTRPELVAQAYFKPENTRKTVPKAFSNLPKSKLKIGAFLVRLGANHTKYCITVLANEKNALEETSYKHILVNQTPGKQYYICERDDEKDYVFSSLEELVHFYTKQTIGIHYHNMDFILNDVWGGENVQMPNVGDLYLQPKASVVKKVGNSQKNAGNNQIGNNQASSFTEHTSLPKQQQSTKQNWNSTPQKKFSKVEHQVKPSVKSVVAPQITQQTSPEFYSEVPDAQQNNNDKQEQSTKFNNSTRFSKTEHQVKPSVKSAVVAPQITQQKETHVPDFYSEVPTEKFTQKMVQTPVLTPPTNTVSIPRTINRYDRAPYSAKGVFKALYEYSSRDARTEMNFKAGDLLVQVGPESGPWLPCVRYDEIQNNGSGPFKVEKRYAAKDYLEPIEFVYGNWKYTLPT